MNYLDSFAYSYSIRLIIPIPIHFLIIPIRLTTYWQLAIFLSKIMNFEQINTRILVLNRIFVQKTGIPIQLK